MKTRALQISMFLTFAAVLGTPGQLLADLVPNETLRKAAEGDVQSMWDAGSIYVLAEQWEKALPFIEEAALKNHAASLRVAGKMYLEGMGTEKDPDKAFRYFQAAAKQEDPIAIFYMGVVYSTGAGCNPDNEKAFHYFKIAADGGSPIAQRNVALSYAKGEGVSRDYQQSFRYAKKGAENHDIQSMKFLALHYRKGIGVAKSVQLADHWDDLAKKAEREASQ